MALNLYVPRFLDREEAAYRAAGGNYSITYTDNGDTYPGTDFVPIDSDIPYAVKGNTFSRNFNVFPLVIPPSTAHVTGEDENWRSTNFNLIATSTLSDEVFTVGFFGSNIFNVELASATYVVGDTDSSVSIVYNVTGFSGHDPHKTLSTLYEGDATIRPMIIESNPVTVGVVSTTDQVTINKLTLAPGLFGTADTGIALDAITNILVVIDSPPETLTDGDDYLPYLDTSYLDVTEFLIQEAVPTNRVNLEVVTGITYDVPTIGGWGVYDNATQLTAFDNYKLLLQDSITLTNDVDLIGYTGVIAKDTGIIFNISVTSLKATTYDFTASYNEFPVYALYTEVEPLRVAGATPYFHFERSGSNTLYHTSTDNIVTTQLLSNGSENEMALWTKVADSNVALAYNGAKSLVTVMDGEFLAVKLAGTDPEKISISNSNSIDITSGTSYFPATGSNNKLSIDTSTFYTTDNTAYDITVAGAGTNLNFLLALPPGEAVDYSVVNHTLELPVTQFNTAKTVVVTYNSTPTAISVTLPTARSSGYCARKLSKQLNDIAAIEGELLILGKPNGHVVVRNLTDQITPLLMTNVFDVFNYPSGTRMTAYNNSFVMPYNTTGLYGFMNIDNVLDETYDSLNDLNGYPISMTIRGYDVSNNFYLKVIKSDNPDLELSEDGSFINNTDNNLVVLTDKLNQYTRAYGVLSSPLNSTDIALYKATGSDKTVLDLYLHSGSTTASPFVATSLSASIASDSTKNYAGLGTNNSKEFWYYENLTKQPIMLDKQTVNNIISDTIYLQFTPGASDTSISMKIESDLTTLDYDIVSVALPTYSLFSSDINTWYSDLATNISTELTSVGLTAVSVVDTYNTATGVAIKLVNDPGEVLRQVKFGLPSGSSVNVVKLDIDTAAVPESQTTGIFAEFATPNNISFWLG